MIEKNTDTTNIETEAKFIVPDEATFVSLKKTTQLGDFWLEPVGVKIILDRYLDTDDHRFLQAGYACRIRTAKQRQVLTLKSLTPPEGNVHRRQELEIEINSEQPDTWPASKAKDLVLSTKGKQPLQTLFVLHQTRHQYHVLFEELPIIELSLDEISLGDINEIDYFELEAELLKAGNEADLFRFMDVLQNNWSLQPENKSKFERALGQMSV